MIEQNVMKKNQRILCDGCRKLEKKKLQVEPSHDTESIKNDKKNSTIEISIGKNLNISDYQFSISKMEENVNNDIMSKKPAYVETSEPQFRKTSLNMIDDLSLEKNTNVLKFLEEKLVQILVEPFKKVESSIINTEGISSINDIKQRFSSFHKIQDSEKLISKEGQTLTDVLNILKVQDSHKQGDTTNISIPHISELGPENSPTRNYGLFRLMALYKQVRNCPEKFGKLVESLGLTDKSSLFGEIET